MPGTIDQVGYCYNHEVFLYDIHFIQVVVPMYVGNYIGNLKTLNTKYDLCVLGLRTSIVMITHEKNYKMNPKKNSSLDHLIHHTTEGEFR